MGPRIHTPPVTSPSAQRPAPGAQRFLAELRRLGLAGVGAALLAARLPGDGAAGPGWPGGGGGCNPQKGNPVVQKPPATAAKQWLG